MPSNTDDATATRQRGFADGRIVLESVDPDAFRAAARRLLAVGGVVFVLALLSVLPGMDRTVPQTPLTVLALVVGAGTLVVVRLLVAAAGDVEDVARQALAGPTELRVTAGVVVKHLVVLAAVLIAYSGLAGVFVPLLAPSETAWLYDLAFLGLALVPVAFVTYYLFGALHPTAAHLTRHVVGRGDTDVGEQAPAEGSQDAPDGPSGDGAEPDAESQG